MNYLTFYMMIRFIFRHEPERMPADDFIRREYDGIIDAGGRAGANVSDACALAYNATADEVAQARTWLISLSADRRPVGLRLRRSAPIVTEPTDYIFA